MNRKSNSRSGLFMMEMMVVVFFFILCAGICIMVFVRANNMSRLAKDTNRGVSAAQSLAEYLHANGEDGFAEYFDGETDGDGNYRFYWDKDWLQTGEESAAVYEAEVSISREDSMLSGDIRILKGKTEVFVLETLRYEPPDRNHQTGTIKKISSEVR